MLLAACHPSADIAPVPTPVVAIAVHPDDYRSTTSLPGQVAARYHTPLSFRVGGNVVERLVRLGDRVKAGEIIARLDPTDLRHSVTAAQARFDAARHRLLYATQQLDRDRAQVRDNLIASTQFEQTEDAYATAAADRKAAQAQLTLAENQVHYAVLVAEGAGVVTSEDVDTGQNVIAGQAIYHLAWSGDIDVVCDAPERVLSELAPGRAGRVSLTALPSKSFAARVREVSPAADPQSLTYRVKLTLLAPTPDVRLGMTASIAFDATDDSPGRDLFTLPATALFHEGEAPAVWVLHTETDTLELRPVSVAQYAERTILIAGGLHDGDRVVLQGVHTLSVGQHVRAIAPLHLDDFTS
jgi:multidrug efflux system membrane fusion protein